VNFFFFPSSGYLLTVEEGFQSGIRAGALEGGHHGLRVDGHRHATHPLNCTDSYITALYCEREGLEGGTAAHREWEQSRRGER